MERELVWKYVGDVADQEAVDRIEQQLGVKLPEDYIECALKNHGAKPKDDIFDIEGHHATDFNRLLCLDPKESDYVLNVYNRIRDRLVDHVYPFASDSFGNAICFDYRNGRENPVVVFWDHEDAFLDKEKGVFPICNSFSELLSKLRPYEG